MRAAKSLKAPVARMKHPCRFALRLYRPVRHSERECGDGQGIATREDAGRVGSLQYVDRIESAGHSGLAVLIVVLICSVGYCMCAEAGLNGSACNGKSRRPEKGSPIEAHLS